MFPLRYLASPGLCRALYHARDISHLEKIRPYYFLLVLFNISSENLVSNKLFFQLLTTCLLESVRYCKEKLHPDQYWEWRFSIGQTNSKCTFLVTLRIKKNCLKFVNPRGESVDFSAKLLWWFDICVVASFLKGRRLSLFCLPFGLATIRTVTEKLYVLKKEQELAPGDQPMTSLILSSYHLCVNQLQIASVARTVDKFFFERIARAVRTDNNFFKRISQWEKMIWQDQACCCLKTPIF